MQVLKFEGCDGLCDAWCDGLCDASCDKEKKKNKRKKKIPLHPLKKKKNKKKKITLTQRACMREKSPVFRQKTPRIILHFARFTLNLQPKDTTGRGLVQKLQQTAASTTI